MEALLELIRNHLAEIFYTAAGTVVAAIIIGSVTAPGREIAHRVRRRLARRAASLASPRIARLDEPLLPRPVPVRGLAVELLRACNGEAAALYREMLAGSDGTARQRAIWDYSFDQEVWTGQRAFVEPRLAGGGDERESPTAVVRRLLREAGPAGSCRVWIQGPAGAGKTTLMTRLFFELIGAACDGGGTEPAAPAGQAEGGRDRRPWRGRASEPRAGVPMLVQPKNLVRKPVRELTAPPEGKTWFQVFVSTWLQNRGISVPEHQLAPLAADLESSLEDGQVVLLLDGYDEFHRMGLQSQARDLLRFPLLVGADRSDEEREKPQDAAVLRLPGHWPAELWQLYLRRRWSAPPRQTWIEPVRDRIASPEAAWLRNPRILAFLVDVLEAQPAFSVEFLHAVTRGEFELLDRVFDDALKRVRALGGEIGAVTKQQVADRLARVAVEQFHGGTYVLPAERMDDGWWAVRHMTEIVTSTESGEFRIDHPMLRDFFLARRITDDLRLNRLPSIERRWSRTTLASAGTILRELDERADDLVWKQLESPTLDLTADPAAAPSARGPLALNLLDLAIRMAADRARAASPALGRRAIRRCILIRDRRLANLDLQHADLEAIRFERCTFDGALLAGANLQDAAFESCSFVGVDFTGCDAHQATFRSCTFLAPGASGASLRVTGMEVAGTAWADGTDVDSATLLAAGAVGLRSRYRTGFFSKRQAWLLGEEEYARLELEYLRLIREAAGRFPRDQPVYMIDLMAGGSNARLIALLDPDAAQPAGHGEQPAATAGGDAATAGREGSDASGTLPNLHVLALDRDTRQLESLGLPPSRLRTWRVEVHGGHDPDGEPLPATGNILEGIDFAEALAAFDGAPRQAHLIVGKKAIHEVPRRLQPLLLRQCVDTLAPGGSLILFTDSPGGMSEEGYRRLEEIRALLVAGDDEPDRLRRRIRQETIELQTFADDAADIALFCNLWTLLKDWANDNRHEFSNRYFSGHDEIVGWIVENGRVELRDEVRGRYRLAPARFNEGAVREIVSHLDSHPEETDEAWSMIRNRLLSPERDRLHLLADFTHHHLLDPAGQRTPLGAALGAGTDRIRFDRLHESLRTRGLEANEDRVRAVAFDFPVHILAFERTGV